MSRHPRAGRNLAVAAIAGGLVLFAASPSLAGADRMRVEGPLVRYAQPEPADTVPAGATARVQTVADAAGNTIVTLHVRGLAPDHAYGAHAHVLACHPTDAGAAGGHFQQVPNPHPVTNPTDPTYVNDRNEIWLDLVTDAEGDGVAQTRVPWQFSPDRRPGSVMIHAQHTSPGAPGAGAGTAGARVACLTVAF